MSTTEVGEIAGGESGDGVCSEMELTVRRLKVRREDINLCPSTTHQNPLLLFRVTGDIERGSLWKPAESSDVCLRRFFAGSVSSDSSSRRVRPDRSLAELPDTGRSP